MSDSCPPYSRTSPLVSMPVQRSSPPGAPDWMRTAPSCVPHFSVRICNGGGGATACAAQISIPPAARVLVHPTGW